MSERDHLLAYAAELQRRQRLADLEKNLLEAIRRRVIVASLHDIGGLQERSATELADSVYAEVEALNVLRAAYKEALQG